MNELELLQSATDIACFSFIIFRESSRKYIFFFEFSYFFKFYSFYCW